MTVAGAAALIPYEAFTTEDRPPAFAVRAQGEAIVFPYEKLVGVGWIGNDARNVLLVEHHFFNVYLHGDNLEPLVEAFRRFMVGDIHVFDSDRHAPAVAGKCVITDINDHYEKAGGKIVKFSQKR